MHPPVSSLEAIEVYVLEGVHPSQFQCGGAEGGGEGIVLDGGGVGITLVLYGGLQDVHTLLEAAGCRTAHLHCNRQRQWYSGCATCNLHCNRQRQWYSGCATYV